MKKYVKKGHGFRENLVSVIVSKFLIFMSVDQLLLMESHNFLMWLFIIMVCGYFIMSCSYFVMSHCYFIVSCGYFITPCGYFVMWFVHYVMWFCLYVLLTSLPV